MQVSDLCSVRSLYDNTNINESVSMLSLGINKDKSRSTGQLYCTATKSPKNSINIYGVHLVLHTDVKTFLFIFF